MAGPTQQQRDEFFEQFPTEESYYDTEYDFAKLLSFFQEASRSKGYYKDSPKGETLMDIFTSAGSPHLDVPTGADRKRMNPNLYEPSVLGSIMSYQNIERKWDESRKNRSEGGGRAHFEKGSDWENQELEVWKNLAKMGYVMPGGKYSVLGGIYPKGHKRQTLNVPTFPMDWETYDETGTNLWWGKDSSGKNIKGLESVSPEYRKKNIVHDPEYFFKEKDELQFDKFGNAKHTVNSDGSVRYDVKRGKRTKKDRWINKTMMHDRIADEFIAELAHGVQYSDLTDEEKTAQNKRVSAEYRKYGDVEWEGEGSNRRLISRGRYGVQGTVEYEAHNDIEDSLKWLLDNPSYYDYQNKPGVSEIK